MSMRKVTTKQSTYVVYNWRTAVVRPGGRGALESSGTMIVTPSTVQRICCHHTLATRRVDTAWLNWHTRYLHNSRATPCLTGDIQLLDATCKIHGGLINRCHFISNYNSCVSLSIFVSLYRWKQKWILYNYLQFTYLMAWWRHNCETSHVMKIYFIQLHVK